jgi:hypothetical protein
LAHKYASENAPKELAPVGHWRAEDEISIYIANITFSSSLLFEG